MSKCDYNGCNNKASKQISTELDNSPYTLNVCIDCYDEYLEAINN